MTGGLDRIADRQLEEEGATLADFRIKADFAAVIFNDGFGNAKTEAGTAHAPGGGGVGLGIAI